MESSQCSRTVGCNLDVIKRERYYSVFCKRQWGDQKTEFIIQRWLQRDQYSQEKDETITEQFEETNFPERSTSTGSKVVLSNRDQCLEIVETNDEVSPVVGKGASQSVKPIIKSDPSAKADTVSVKFNVPESTVGTASRLKEFIVRYTDRCVKFFNRPICRIITGFVCCVMLPCTLICATMFYLVGIQIQEFNRQTVSRNHTQRAITLYFMFR